MNFGTYYYFRPRIGETANKNPANNKAHLYCNIKTIELEKVDRAII